MRTAEAITIKEDYQPKDKSEPRELPIALCIAGKVYFKTDFLPNIERWTCYRKQEIGAAVLNGILTLDEVLNLYPYLSKEEVLEWAERSRTYQIDDLKIAATESLALRDLLCTGKGEEQHEDFTTKESYEACQITTLGEMTVRHDGLVTFRGKFAKLTRQQGDILRLLIQNPDTVIRKWQIYKEVFCKSRKPSPERRIVDVQVCNVRKAIKRAGLIDPIETVWGIGYLLNSKTLAAK